MHLNHKTSLKLSTRYNTPKYNMKEYKSLCWNIMNHNMTLNLNFFNLLFLKKKKRSELKGYPRVK